MSLYRLVGVTTPQAADKLIASGATLAGEPLFVTRYPGLAALRVRADHSVPADMATFQRQQAAALAAGALLPASFDNPLIDEVETLRVLAVGHARLSHALDVFSALRQYRIVVSWNPVVAMAHCATQGDFKLALSESDGDQQARSRMIAHLMDGARTRLGSAAMLTLRGAAAAIVSDAAGSDTTVANLVVLIERAKEATFDSALEDVYASFPDLSIEQLGPQPPAVFATVVIERPSARDIAEAKLTLQVDTLDADALQSVYQRLGRTMSQDAALRASVTKAYRLLERLEEANRAGGDRNEPILVDLVDAGGGRWAA